MTPPTRQWDARGGTHPALDHERAEIMNVLEPIVRDNVAQMQAAMADADVDALVLNRSDNLRYLAGFGPYDSFSLSDENAAIVTPDGPPTLVASPRLAADLRERHWLDEIEPFTPTDGVSAGVERKAGTVATLLEERGLADARIGVDPYMRYTVSETLRESLPGASFVDAGDLLWRARAVKSDAELAIIDEGLSVAEIGIRAGLDAVEEGVRESEVSGAIMDAMISAGAAGAYALPAIVSSGVRWSRCQEYPSRKRIRRGEFVQLDEGPMWKGYYSEFARMTMVGTPSEHQREVYRTTWAAHRAAIDAMGPGVSGVDVYEASRREFADRGHEEWMTDGLIGHGIGVAAHEPPYITPDNDVTLEENMVVMIEPGLFKQDDVGVRFEDMVLVTDTGTKVLSRTEHPDQEKFL